MDLSPILVVDEQSDLRTKLAQSLNRSGFAVEGISNGSEALKKIESAKYSMVISDEKIKDSGGMDILRSIKKISPQIPVIIMTANGTVHNAVEAMQAGASDYLLKPFSL
ncbi:MAG: response regulator, partial [Desulfobacterales bacterium]|nr:response regulator [Desulfobacterales bacterium]